MWLKASVFSGMTMNEEKVITVITLALKAIMSF